jgi:hypothetical protein
MNLSGKFPMPESSWEVIKKILRGYRAVQDHESPTVEGIAKLAGIHRPVLSMNNNFLREIGIVQPEKYKLTDLGSRLAAGITMSNSALTASAIQTVIRQNGVLNTLMGMLDARGEMSIPDFKAELMLLVGLNEKSRQLHFVKTVLDMFQDGGLIRINDNMISLPDSTRESEPKQSVSRGSDAGALPIRQASGGQVPAGAITGVPLALAPNRVAYVVLPEDWDGAKDLKKFLRLAELALGDGPVE